MFSIRMECCIQCGLCQKVCSYATGNIEMTEHGPSFLTQNCFLCGHCVAVCPRMVISNPEIGSDEDVTVITAEQAIPKEEELKYLMQKRRSIRIFKKEKVERVLLRKVIDSGRFCASSGNAQSLHYIVLSDKLQEIRSYIVESFSEILKDKDKAYEIFGGNQSYISKWEDICKQECYPKENSVDRFTFGALDIILIVGEDMYQIDAGIVSENMELMANTLGLGCCYIGFFRTAALQLPELKSKLMIPESQEVLNAIAIGYPAISYKQTVIKKEARIDWL